MSKISVQRAGERGHANHGWLDAHHSFSFASWYDPNKTHFGVLRVLNDDIIAPGMGFGRHPHDNMEIITIVLDGVLNHQDSLGHVESLLPGEVQVMSAGTGLTHSEFNGSKQAFTNLLQIWIFPDTKDVKPRYEQKMFDGSARINQLQNVVAPINDSNADALKIHQNAWIYRCFIDEGNSITHKVHGAKQGVYLFVITGKITVNGEYLNKRDAAGITDSNEIEIKATEGAELLLLEVPMGI